MGLSENIGIYEINNSFGRLTNEPFFRMMSNSSNGDIMGGYKWGFKRAILISIGIELGKIFPNPIYDSRIKTKKEDTYVYSL